MTSVTGTEGGARTRNAARLALMVPVAQVCLFGVLWLAWSTGESDATATSVDWEFVGLAAATPAALAISAGGGVIALRRYRVAQPRLVRAIAIAVECITVGLGAVTLALAPIVILGAVVFAPMG